MIPFDSLPIDVVVPQVPSYTYELLFQIPDETHLSDSLNISYVEVLVEEDSLKTYSLTNTELKQMGNRTLSMSILFNQLPKVSKEKTSEPEKYNLLVRYQYNDLWTKRRRWAEYRVHFELEIID